MLAVAPQARADTTDLSVTCDTAAAPAMIRTGAAYTAATGVRIRVHATEPGLVLPQMQREIQNDILFTQAGILDQLEQAGLVQPGGRGTAWRNRLVLGATNPSGGADGSCAAPDPSPACGLDGPAILRHLGLTATQGALDTDAVAWLLKRGQVRFGLLLMSDVAADPLLTAARPVPDDAWPPIRYAATVSRLASRPNPDAFVAFLDSADGRSILRHAGLEGAA
jgi:ABC-type molybdate transport system substrate-binding protein